MPRSPAGGNLQKRTAIADAALRIIGTKGLTELTMTSLAAEVGVTSGALFRHFASRDEILEETASRVVELVGATFPEAGLPPLERIEGLFRARTEVLGKESGIARLVFSDQFTKALPAPAAARIHEVVKRTRAYLLQALKEAAGAGLLRTDIPPEDLLIPLMGTLQHLGFLTAIAPAKTGSRRPDPARVLATLMILFRTAKAP